MVDDARLQVVRDFLRAAFPRDQHRDEVLPLRDCHLFRMDRRGQPPRRLVVTAEFLTARQPAEIAEALRQRRVVRLLKRAGGYEVLVTQQASGIWPG